MQVVGEGTVGFQRHKRLAHLSRASLLNRIGFSSHLSIIEIFNRFVFKINRFSCHIEFETSIHFIVGESI
jgi:hypothetical protein